MAFSPSDNGSDSNQARQQVFATSHLNREEAPESNQIFPPISAEMVPNIQQSIRPTSPHKPRNGAPLDSSFFETSYRDDTLEPSQAMQGYPPTFDSLYVHSDAPLYMPPFEEASEDDHEKPGVANPVLYDKLIRLGVLPSMLIGKSERKLRSMYVKIKARKARQGVPGYARSKYDLPVGYGRYEPGRRSRALSMFQSFENNGTVGANANVDGTASGHGTFVVGGLAGEGNRVVFGSEK